MDLNNEVNIQMKNIEYTLCHKQAMVGLCSVYIKEGRINDLFDKALESRIKEHDMDKVIMLMLGYNKKDIQKIHRYNNPHHIDSFYIKNQLDIIEAILDWESARYTKDDKPLNAYETLITYYAEYRDIVNPVLQSMGLANMDDSKNAYVEKKVAEYKNSLTQDKIIKTIAKYLSNKGYYGVSLNKKVNIPYLKYVAIKYAASELRGYINIM